MTIVRRIAVTSALILSVFGLSASAASAGEVENIHTKGGSVGFNDKNEIVVAFDHLLDGYGVRAYLSWRGGKAWVTDYGAYGDTASMNLSLREGTPVWLTMCYINKKGAKVKCSSPQRATA
jgi:hypothetical protein